MRLVLIAVALPVKLRDGGHGLALAGPCRGAGEALAAAVHDLLIAALTFAACTAAAVMLWPESSAMQASGERICWSLTCALRMFRRNCALAVLEASVIPCSAPTCAFS